jgi:glucosamine-6-phosphate deaminase
LLAALEGDDTVAATKLAVEVPAPGPTSLVISFVSQRTTSTGYEKRRVALGDDCVSENTVRRFKVDELEVSIHETNDGLGKAAALEAADIIRDAIARCGRANIVLATGNSQKSFLAGLRIEPGIDWPKVSVFHLDEYLGIDPAHPASFPNFLRRHIIDHVHPGAFYPLTGSTEDAARVCREYERLLRSHPTDLYALGIGENGHLAFNDPPGVDFADPAWVKVVKLAPRSRQQQVDERHFASLSEVPEEAVTVTIPAMISASRILVMVPEARKAEAVRNTLYGPITEEVPSSILRRCPRAKLFLDLESGADIYPSARL